MNLYCFGHFGVSQTSKLQRKIHVDVSDENQNVGGDSLNGEKRCQGTINHRDGGCEMMKKNKWNQWIKDPWFEWRRKKMNQIERERMSQVERRMIDDYIEFTNPGLTFEADPVVISELQFSPFSMANGQVAGQDEMKNLSEWDQCTLDNISKISCFYGHTLILMNNGMLFSVGNNFFGQLGNGETSDELSPYHVQFQYHNKNHGSMREKKEKSVGIQVLDSEPNTIRYTVLDISAGSCHSAAIVEQTEYCEDGNQKAGNQCKILLYTWGSSQFGQLGHGSLRSELVPRCVSYFDTNQFQEVEKLVQVECGEYHTVILTSSGSVYAFGRALEGQLGILCHLNPVTYTPLQYEDRCKQKWMKAGGERVKQNMDHFNENVGLGYFEELGDRECEQQKSIKIIDHEVQSEGSGSGTSNHVTTPLPQGRKSASSSTSSSRKNHIELSDEIKKGSLEYICTPKRMKVLEKLSKKEIKGPLKRDFIPILKIACGTRFTILLDDKGRLFGCGEGMCGEMSQGNCNATNYNIKELQFNSVLSSRPIRTVRVDINLMECATRETKETDNPMQDNEQRPDAQKKGRIGDQKDCQEFEIQVKSEYSLQFSKAEFVKPRIVDVSCGYGHIVCITDSGDLYACGMNNYGQCGQEHVGKVLKLSAMSIPNELLQCGISQIVAGGTYTSCISNKGEIYFWGRFPSHHLVRNTGFHYKSLVQSLEDYYSRLSCTLPLHSTLSCIIKDFKNQGKEVEQNNVLHSLMNNEDVLLKGKRLLFPDCGEFKKVWKVFPGIGKLSILARKENGSESDE